jgi:hypothetical protein
MKTCIKQQIVHIEARLYECYYKMQGTYPHPHWFEEAKALEVKLKKLKQKIGKNGNNN